MTNDDITKAIQNADLSTLVLHGVVTNGEYADLVGGVDTPLGQFRFPVCGGWGTDKMTLNGYVFRPYTLGEAGVDAVGDVLAATYQKPHKLDMSEEDARKWVICDN